METQTKDRADTVKDAIEQMVAAFCQRPENLLVGTLEGERKLMLVLTVDPVDYGAVLGRNMATLLALKELASFLGREAGYVETDVKLDGIEDRDKATRQKHDHKFIPVDQQRIEKLMVLTLAPLVDGEIWCKWLDAAGWCKLIVTCQGIRCGGPRGFTKLDWALARLVVTIGGRHGAKVLFELVEAG